jgi:hypothetical protein
MPLPLGTQTEWGKIEMVVLTGGERYYWMIDKYKCVSMIPAFIVEPMVSPNVTPKKSD